MNSGREESDGRLGRAMATVERYFGDQIDEVALATPVSRPTLVASLARLQVEAWRRRGTLAVDGAVLARRDDETVFSLQDDTWRSLSTERDLSETEARTAREVHLRMAGYLDVGQDHPHDVPFVLVHGAGGNGHR